MGRYVLGKKLDTFNGVTDTQAVGTLRVRNVGKVPTSGRIVRVGSWLGADGTLVDRMKLAAYLIDPGTLDPTTKLLETAEGVVSPLWTGNGAGGANFELPAAYLWTPGYWYPWFWLKADSLSGLTSGAAVATWQDSSVNNRNAANATGTEQPTFQAGQINGLPVVRFDGVDDDLTITGINLPKPLSVFFVLKSPPTQTSEARIYQGGAALAAGRMNVAAGQASLYAGTNLPYATGLPVSTWQVHSHIFNGASSFGALNGTKGSVGNVGAGGTATNLTIGSAGSTLFSAIDLLEMVAFPWAMSDFERQVVEGYLAYRAGLQANLPTTHLFKSAPYYLQGAKVLKDQEIGVGVVGNQSLRRPARFFVGGKKWEQSTSSLALPNPMVPTVETVDDKDISSYVVIEENRPPVVTKLTPVNSTILPWATFTVETTDPDKTDGFGDYISNVVIRFWEKVKGALQFAGYRSDYWPTNDGGSNRSLTNVFVQLSTDFGTRMTSWLPAYGMVQADSTPVATWPDYSGNNNSATQATGTAQPTFRTNQIAGNPAVDFDGTTDFMTLPQVTTVNNDEAIFVLLKVDTLTTTRTILGNTAAAGRALRINTAGQVEVVATGVGTVFQTVGTVTVGQWTIVSFIQRPNRIRVGINANMENTYADPGFGTGGTQILGSTLATGFLFFDGMIADIVRMKASDLRPGDEERIIGYLAQGYGLGANTPTGFPYKVSGPTFRVSFPPTTERGSVSVNRFEDVTQTDLITPYTNNTAVATWPDSRFTSPQNATQATGANQPIYRANQINGKGAVDFDGVNDFMGTAISASTRDEAIFAVVNVRNPTLNPLIVGPSAVGGRIFYVANPNILAWGKWGSTGFAGPVVTPNEWHVVHLILRSSSYELGVDGVSVFGLDSTAFTASLTTQFGAGAGSSNWLSGMIAKVVRMQASQLYIDDVDRWVGKLAWEYGLQAKLPETHMYRWEAPGDPVEHHWTAEVRDEIGGVTGTGYGARSTDDDTPDGTSKFFVSMMPYVDVGSDNGSKKGRITPDVFGAVAQNPSGLSINKWQVRLLEKDANGVYNVIETSPTYKTVALPPPAGNALNWSQTGFHPLRLGGDYAYEWKVADVGGNESPWSGTTYFHVNYLPQKGVVSSPSIPAVVTGLPTIIFSVDDDDDAGVAWFAPIANAIYELNFGTFGSANGQFAIPSGMDFDLSGNLLVADAGNTRIQKFDSNGVWIANIATSGQPQDIEINPSNGNITYSNGIGKSFIRLNSAGSAVLETYAFTPALYPYHLGMGSINGVRYLFFTWKGHPFWRMVQSENMATGGTDPLSQVRTNESVLKGPNGIAFYAYPTGNMVWVADKTDNVFKRYQAFDTAQGTLDEIFFDDDHLHQPFDVVVHPKTGNVWITEQDRRRIVEYSYYGDFIGEFGGRGSTAGLFTTPGYMTFNSVSSKIYVSDLNQPHVNRFRLAVESDYINTGVCGEVLIKGPITVPNMSFDLDTTGWTYSEGLSFTEALTILSDTPNDGRGYLRITQSAGPAITGLTANFQLTTSTGNEFPVVPEHVYGIKAKFRRSNASLYGQIGIQWQMANGTVISTSWSDTVRPDPTTVWLTVSVSDEAPTDAAKAAIILLAGTDIVSATYPAYVDWDHVEIDDGVRYIRGATFVSGDDYLYTMVSNDIPANGAYTVQVRGRDGNGPGEWSDPITVNKVAGPTATLLSPTSGQVFNTATPTFLWQLTGGSQWAYKIEVLDTNGNLFYTSDWVQSVTDRSFTVPRSAGLVDGGSYLGRLWIDDGKLQVLV